jgi:hypothetical protein
MKRWSELAELMGLNLPPEQIEKIAPSLDGLEAAFAPLRGSIPHEMEPAIIHRVPEKLT